MTSSFHNPHSEIENLLCLEFVDKGAEDIEDGIGDCQSLTSTMRNRALPCIMRA